MRIPCDAGVITLDEFVPVVERLLHANVNKAPQESHYVSSAASRRKSIISPASRHWRVRCPWICAIIHAVATQTVRRVFHGRLARFPAGQYAFDMHVAALLLIHGCKHPPQFHVRDSSIASSLTATGHPDQVPCFAPLRRGPVRMCPAHAAVVCGGMCASISTDRTCSLLSLDLCAGMASPLTASAQLKLGATLRMRGQVVNAIAAYEKALGVFTALYGHEHKVCMCLDASASLAVTLLQSLCTVVFSVMDQPPCRALRTCLGSWQTCTCGLGTWDVPSS